MKSPVHRDVQIDALRDAGNARRSDAIAVEEPLEIRLMRDGLPEADENGGTGRSISITMRTPGHDAELAVGFLYGEGLLRDSRDVVDTGFCGPTGNILRVTVRADLPLDLGARDAQFLHHFELRRLRQGLHRSRDRERRRPAHSQPADHGS